MKPGKQTFRNDYTQRVAVEKKQNFSSVPKLMATGVVYWVKFRQRPDYTSNCFVLLTLRQRACRVKVWCTKIGCILRIVSKLEQTGQLDRVTSIITHGSHYFWKN